jgi:hypothetical protein
VIEDLLHGEQRDLIDDQAAREVMAEQMGMDIQR